MCRQLMQRLFLFCITLIFSLTFSFNHVQAQSVPFYWEFINVDIAVQTNGDMLITETQKYTFTGKYNNQRSRYIPLDKVDEITEVSVTENGRLLPSETGIENNQRWIRWKHQLKAPESDIFVLKYRVVGGLHVNDNDAQVYWKAIFSDRKAPIKQARVRVELPEKFAASIKDFQSFGISTNIRKVNSKTIEAVAETAIKPGEDLEIQVTFDRTGTEIKPPIWQSSQSEDSLFKWIFWAILLLIVYRILFSRKSVSVTYEHSSSSYEVGGYGGDGGDGGGGGGGGD
ncbi:DUF2207 domain-containing protein [Anabaena sp. UHCC 0399]|uniref:DUF2207 domain-containing protein n=1 Tax=Anabaena sp. UHCC 0399 TaxID=3110238 RepID=UPI002B20981D|nr:DUF2207 domain-containing protein [Anabaena sp. UHCC 0399]MEA5568130.1 DUF2207 domain-containing protein [Anabaena sp. UHCC 0399]